MFWVKLLLLLFTQAMSFAAQSDESDVFEELKPPPPHCDLGKNIAAMEGNLGQTEVFPWLGVLKIHIHTKDSMQVALTGVVLVKAAYVVGSADDITRIPRNIFKQHSTAMFISKRNEPWYTQLKEYITHPEYEFSTLNTIALVELESPLDIDYPMMPICWPSYFYNASENLYAMGYHDQNQALEKNLFSLDFVETRLCEEFYNRVGFKSQDHENTVPTHLLCGFARHNKKSCTWDNGMVMASNTTGVWMLLGLGVRGPGCAAPARFIELLPYLPWINSALGIDDINDREVYRRRNTPDISWHSMNPFVTNRQGTSRLIIRNAASNNDVCNKANHELFFHEIKEMSMPKTSGNLVYKVAIKLSNITSDFCSILELNSKDHNASIEIVNNDDDKESKLKVSDTINIAVDSLSGLDHLDWDPWIKAEDIDEYLSDRLKPYNIFIRLSFNYEAVFDIKALRPKKVFKNESEYKKSDKFFNFDKYMSKKHSSWLVQDTSEIYDNDTLIKLLKENEKPLDIDLKHYDTIRIPESKDQHKIVKKDYAKIEDEMFHTDDPKKTNLEGKLPDTTPKLSHMLDVKPNEKTREDSKTKFNGFEIKNMNDISKNISNIENLTKYDDDELTEKNKIKEINTDDSEKLNYISTKESALIKGLVNRADIVNNELHATVFKAVILLCILVV